MTDPDPKAAITPAELKEARQKLGLTQAQLAYVLGITDRGLRYLEAGEREISPPIERLLRAYLDGHRPEDWPDGARQRKLAKQARERKRQ